MGLFDKKFCDVCGNKIGLLGNKKLEDGNICKECAGKLSPWFHERKSSTLAQIKEQLEYREANKKEVENFSPTLTLGRDTKVIIDEDSRRFMVTSASNFKNANPDILSFSDVTGCSLDIRESRGEIKRKDSEGKEISYNPPRYEYDYDFYMTVNVNNPYFEQMTFKINPSSVTIEQGALVRKPDPMTNVSYVEYKNMGEQIVETLTAIREEHRSSLAPKQAVVCPYCGATTIPDANGCCEYCGGAIGK